MFTRNQTRNATRLLLGATLGLFASFVHAAPPVPATPQYWTGYDEGVIYYIAPAQSFSYFVDPDSDIISFTLISNGGENVYNPVSTAVVGEFFLNPTDLNANGIQDFAMTATDATGNSATFFFTLEIAGFNDPLTLTPPGIPDQVMAEDGGTLNVNALSHFDDVDFPWGLGDTHRVISVVSDSPGLVSAAIDAVASGVDLTPIADQFGGPATITVTVADLDGLGFSEQDSFTVMVTPTNDPVTGPASFADVNVLEDVGLVSVDMTGVFSDIDVGDTHTITVTSPNDGLIAATNSPLTSLSGALTFAVTPDENGTSNITVVAADQSGGSASISFAINVAPQNDPPTVIPPGIADQVMTEDTPASVLVLSSFDDIDFTRETDVHRVINAVSGDPTLVSVAVNAAGTGVDMTPVADQSGGPAVITVTVADNNGLGATVDGTFNVTVNPANDPVTGPASFADVNVLEDAGLVSVNMTGVFSDIDVGDTHTITVTSPSDGLIAATNSPLASLSGALTFAVTPDENGTSNITVVAADQTGASASISFAINVAPQNDPPTVKPPGIADQVMTEDTPGSVLVLSSFDDIDFTRETDVHRVINAVSSVPTLVSVAVNAAGTGVDMTPVADQSGGPAVITVTVADNNGLGATVDGTFNVTVNPVNDPVTGPASFADVNVLEDAGLVSVDMTGVFSDVDVGDTHTITVTSLADGLTAPTNSPLASLSGALTFAVTPDENGTSNITVVAADQTGASASISFAINVAPQNDPPTVIPPGIADQVMTEDTPASVLVLSSFDDIDFTRETDVHRVINAVSGDPTLVSVAVNAAGTGVDMTPVADQSGGPAVITVTVADNNGLGATVDGTFNVTVNPVNDPVTGPASFADVNVLEDAGLVSVNMTGVFSDVDVGDTHTITVTSLADGLTAPTNSPLASLSGALTFAVTPDENGTSNITVVAADQTGASASISFAINVAAVNDPPTVVPPGLADLTMDEDELTRAVLVVSPTLFDDVDFSRETDIHRVTNAVSSDPSLVTVTIRPQHVDVTPVADQFGGPATITVTVTDQDGLGLSVQDSFDVMVNPLDDGISSPGNIPDQFVNEDTVTVTVSINGVFEDIDLPADSHTVTVVGNTNAGLVTPMNSLTGLTGNLNFAVTPDGNGFATITVEAQDASLNTAQESFTINVAPLDDAPFVENPIGDQIHTEDAGNLIVNFTGAFNDADLGNPNDIQDYTFSVDNTTLVTTASIAGDNITLGFGPDQNGAVNVTITVTDNAGLTASDTFAVTVNPVNDNPFVENPIGSINVNEDAPDTVIDLYTVFNDPDIATNADSLTFTLTSNDNPLLFNSVTVLANQLTLSYATNQIGTANLSVTAQDGAALSVTDSFTVVITEVVPIANSDTATMVEDGTPIIIDVLSNDFLGEPPTVITLVGRNWPDPVTGPNLDVTHSTPTTVFDEGGVLVTEPNGSLVIAAGMVEYTPKDNFNGSDYFDYVITDSDGDTSTGTVNITVTPQPDAPRVFGNPEYTVKQGTFLSILPEGGLADYALDDDGNGIEVRLVAPPTEAVAGGFTLYPDGSFDYLPRAAYGGTTGDIDSFDIYYWDEDDGLASETITVTILFDPDEGVVAAAPPGEVEFDYKLADVPLEDAIASEANVLVMMDDSGSMDWSVMTAGSGGEFRISNSGVRNSGVSNYARTFRYVHQLATNIYTGNRNVPTEEALAADPAFNGHNYGVWRARNAQYSTVYYNPRIHYVPWVGLNRSGNEFADANPLNAVLDPFDATVRTLNLTALHSFNSDNVPGITQRRKRVVNSNVYLPYYYDTTAVGRPVWDAPHTKVTIDGSFPVVLADGSSVSYYPGGPDRTDCAEAAGDTNPLECTFAEELQNFTNWFSYYRSREYSSKAALGRAISSASNIRMGYAVLNDANERERIDSLNASFRVGHKKDLMDQVYKIDSNGSTPLRRALDRAGRHFECRSGDAFGSSSSSSPGDAACPVLSDPEGQCQNNFTLLFSDGTWNGSFSGSNHDKDGGSPDPSPSAFDGGMFEDNFRPSLADIAMYYYERDLHPGLADGVPTTLRDQDWAPLTALQNDGEIMHQHMKTYTVGFGLVGTITEADLPSDYTLPFAWGDPFSQGLAKIDDMLHAAVNSRGQFLQANNPVLLSQAFAEAFEEFSDGSVSVSAVAFNSTALREETIEYRGFFNLKFNSGDLRALSVDDTTGAVDNANPLWRASVQMNNINPTGRLIVSWDDNLETGMEFDFADLNADQLGMLSEDETDWLRGDRANEEPSGSLRAREDVEGMLGDIVHSAPQFVGTPRAFQRDQSPYPTSNLYSDFAANVADRDRVVYVAANDGMLHGFDAGSSVDVVGTGNEIFAYVPNKIIDSTERFANDLDQLTSLIYAHRYFVDLTPSVEDVYIRRGSGSATKSWNTVLVGGLGGGGKGYFALNVTDPDNDYSTPTSAKGVVLWEFTDEDDLYPVDGAGQPLVDGGGNPLLDLGGDPIRDLGYAFSQPQIVMTNAEDGSGEKIWMAVMGNGYNSTAGIAKLFLLDINGGIDGWDAGEVIKLNTGEGVKPTPDPDAGLPNGLGNVAMVDDDGNGTADRAYAGDLFGNLFRFDISSTNTSLWRVTKVFQASYDETAATRQAITTQPHVFKHPSGEGFMVVFGTGGYITEDDGVSTEIQSIYGIWDRDETSPATADADGKSTRLVEQTVINIVDEANSAFERQRIVSRNPVVYVPDDNLGNDGVYGWFIDLDMPRAADTLQGNANLDLTGNAPPAAQFPGEKAIRRFIARGNALLVTTVIPRDANTCFRAPPGATWPVDAITGGDASRAILDINNDNIVDENDLVTYNGEQYASGILFDTDDLDGTLVDPSLLIGRGNEDFLFLSGGDDQITLRIAGPEDSKTGRLSWRELEEAQ